jgi:hypothetical protein
VSHDQRPISTIHSCVIGKDRPQNFEIIFRDAAKKKLVNRHYEVYYHSHSLCLSDANEVGHGYRDVDMKQTETKMECAEIVAKINFLMSLNPPQPLPT